MINNLIAKIGVRVSLDFLMSDGVLSVDNLELIKNALKFNTPILLVGLTGSGKTTVLAAISHDICEYLGDNSVVSFVESSTEIQICNVDALSVMPGIVGNKNQVTYNSPPVREFGAGAVIVDSFDTVLSKLTDKSGCLSMLGNILDSDRRVVIGLNSDSFDSTKDIVSNISPDLMVLLKNRDYCLVHTVKDNGTRRIDVSMHKG